MLKRATKDTSIPYVRVGTDYFKLITKPDRFGIHRKNLMRWNKEEIKLDHGPKYLYDIPKYDTFIIEPNNNGGAHTMENCYNMYADFPHTPKTGSWYWTKILLEHIFGNQFDAGLTYLKVLYQYPKQALPILTLVSEERETGKSTFLDWMNMLFGENMVMIEPDVIGGSFNGEYAIANIIGIDETIIDKQIAVEKIKSLATKKFISVNIKNVQQFKLPFFGKIILASNNEDKFMKVDDKEIRFWVRKLPRPKIENHNILNDMIAEIPAFLHHLKQLREPDFTRSRMVLTEEQIQNEELMIVKEESKSGLYQDMKELFIDFFNRYPLDQVEVVPIDVKQRWFQQNNIYTLNYIRRTMRHEFKFALQEVKRYLPFGEGDQRIGAPYLVRREQFTTEKALEEEKPPF